MSVDERLRDAFDEADPAWPGRAVGALAEVTRRHRRETLVRRVAATGAVAAAMAVGAVALSHGTTDRSAPIPPATESPTPLPAAETFPLDGTWTSGPLTRADVRRAAAAAGDASDLAPMAAALPASPFRIVLVVDEAHNSLALRVVRAGEEEQVFDEANVEVTGDRLVLHPRFAEGEDVQSWTVVGGVLRLAFVSTTEADSDGVPAQAWQRLLYDSAAFTRQGGPAGASRG